MRRIPANQGLLSRKPSPGISRLRADGPGQPSHESEAQPATQVNQAYVAELRIILHFN